MSIGVTNEATIQASSTGSQTAPNNPEFEADITARISTVPEKTTHTETIGPVTIKAKTVDELNAIKGEKPTIEGFIKSKYGIDEENYSPMVKNIIRTVREYVAKMSYNSIVDAVEGKRQQLAFYQMLRGILDTDKTSDALMHYDIVLFAVYLNQLTTFTENLTARFIDALPENIQQQFLDIMHLVTTTANPQGRVKAIKKINLYKFAGRAASDKISANIMVYYTNNI